ncbi:MAG: putative DNA polymerase [Prokaryotic dsDNA virus sp.]|jgi:DNA polymerase-1|nr:MAG: putative DNA polymerase [Prokaryotic dsDNA virus sp.]|tara:strand:- start:7023 stop:9692 length:2670 start_codon:yes stop_codon:yes gene_type:complete
MRYLTFDKVEHDRYKFCILTTELRSEALEDAYLIPHNLDRAETFALSLHQTAGKKKTPMAEMKAYVEEMLQPTFDDLSVEYLIVADGDYFKAITGATKVEATLGYVLDSAFGSQKVVYVPNHRTIFYDPDRVREKIARSISALQEHDKGTYEMPGSDIIHHAAYPTDFVEIEKWLEKLHQYPELTVDIEGFSLKFTEAGIGTITFCWNKHEGVAFPVDYFDRDPVTDELVSYQHSAAVRAALKRFFETYQGKTTYHSITYDVTVLIYQLFMKDILDTEGLLYGLEVMLRDWDCTKIITYLAVNSCAGNKLDLKSNSQEYCGNYALGDELKDITRIKLPRLLEYNLIDGLATWFVKEKHEPMMDADDQREIYETLFKPAVLDIVQMQLTGMPVNMERAIEVDEQLTTERDRLRASILAHPVVKQFTTDYLDVEHARKRNEKLKKKQIKPGDEPQVFNPGSDPQKRALFFDWLQLPVINLTDSKLPSTDGESIEALINRTDSGEVDPALKSLLEDFQLLAIIEILTSNFMPAILGAVEGPPDPETGVCWHYLFGNFNIGGTLSGRLSSSGPNLQNLPSTGKGHKLKLYYAKLIKSCFQAPPGWLFCGVDFSSLEDRISALTTKDPNKLKVYLDGFDGHSLRAFAYWPDKMPDIDGSSVDSINSIAKKYKPLRDKSKNPTFTLTYQGTKHALMKKYGFSEAEADEVVARYQELYQVSIDWVDDKLDQAMIDGYITGAFGLRVRTPLLAQVIRGTSKTPYEAEAEGRTAGNALGQSWCLLNSRAGSEFLGKVRKSEFRLKIRPTAQIHDAGYFLIKDDIRAITYTNEHLIQAVEWQDHPDIWHDEVKLGGELSIFQPTWNEEIVIPNGAEESQIFAIIDDHLRSLQEGSQGSK